MSKIITLKDKDTIIYPRTIYKQVCGDKSDKFGNVQGFIEGLTPVPESPYKYYTVRIDLNNPDPETSCTYMDDAVGMTPGYDGWKDTNLISGIRPCILRFDNGITSEPYYFENKENMSIYPSIPQTLAPEPTGGYNDNVMVEFPLMGYKLWNDDSYQYVSVTDDPNAEDKGYCYYAHSLNTEKDCDKIYIGVFLSSQFSGVSWINSSANEQVYTNISLSKFRDYIEETYNFNSENKNYSLISFYPQTLLQCLYVIMYKNLNSQAALGQGYIDASAVDITGITLSQPFCYGDPNNGTKHVKFLGIEDMWGNISQFLDGVYGLNDGVTIKTDYRNLVFTGTTGSSFQFTHYAPSNNGYLKKIVGNNTSGFLGNDLSDESSVYYSDFASNASGFGTIGGAFNFGTDAGIFHYELGLNSSTFETYIGSRLMYKHLANAGGGQ